LLRAAALNRSARCPRNHSSSRVGGRGKKDFYLALERQLGIETITDVYTMVVSAFRTNTRYERKTCFLS
jgi:hypothetical protein